MIKNLKGVLWKVGKQFSLRVWSDLIFVVAFLIPALVLFWFAVLSISGSFRDQSRIDSERVRQVVQNAYQAELKELEKLAASFFDDRNVRLLFGSLNNVDLYEEENATIRNWLNKELMLQKEAHELDGIAIITLNRELLANTNSLEPFSDKLLKTPLVREPQFRNSISGIQVIPSSDGNSTPQILMAARVPILENDKISGGLIAYRYLNLNSHWLKQLIEELDIHIRIYFNLQLTFSASPENVISVWGTIIRFLNIWPSTEVDKTFRIEQTANRPYQKYFHLQDFKKQPVGIVVTQVDTHQYDDGIMTVLFLSAGGAMVWIALGIIFRIWALRIINRIHSVADSIREISRGNYSSRLATDGHKEISDLSQEINKMAQEIQKREKLKDDFLTSTSHELRTPLLGIIGLAESMAEGAGTLPDEAKAQLSIIASSGNRLSKLINDILDVAKLRNDDLSLQKKPIDVRSMVEVVFNLLKPLVGLKELVLINRISPDTPMVLGDEERVIQIFFNLIGNAIKYTETGSITVKTTTLKDQNQVRIQVEDTGIGIPEKELQSIFESFHQVTDSHNHTGGTGLGLSLSRHLVELHGGEIGVVSEPRVGSTFHFTLPISTKSLSEISSYNVTTVVSGPIVPANRPQESNKSDADSDVVSSDIYEIVVVDDDPVNLQVIAGYLKSDRFKTVVFDSGEKALEYLNNRKPNLVLLDIMMPVLSGFEVCRRIRKTYTIDKLPVIFLTAKNQVSDLLEGFSSGANDYITKPFLKNELLVRIDRHLDTTRIIRRLSSLNTFSDLLKKIGSTRQMMELFFDTACRQLEVAGGVMLYKHDTVCQYHHNESDWVGSFSKLNHDSEEILILNDSGLLPTLSLQISGFEDYQIILRHSNQTFRFSSMDREYLNNLVNRIKGSRYQFEELLKDPNLLISLFKIQSKINTILYVKTKSPYCYIYFQNQEQPEMHRISLKLLRRYFHEDVLMKVQRSYLVNTDKVMGIRKSGKDDVNIILENGISLPVSRNLIPRLSKRFPQM